MRIVILVSTLNSRILSALDSEDSERYLFDQDIKPAINSAMETLITWLNQAFGENKLTPENLRELVNVKVWQANSYSRVSFNAAVVGHDLWTLLAIYPKPVLNKKLFTPGSTNNSESKYRPDVSFVSSNQAAKRLTLEEWNENQKNAFMPGNDLLQGDISEYGYLDASNYTSSTYPGNGDPVEWTIRPSVANQFVAIAYLKYPNQVATINDSIEFPKSLTELITELALNKISEKQSDGTNLAGQSVAAYTKLIALLK